MTFMQIDRQCSPFCLTADGEAGYACCLLITRSDLIIVIQSPVNTKFINYKPNRVAQGYGPGGFERLYLLVYSYSLSPLISLIRERMILLLMLMMPGNGSITSLMRFSIFSADEATA